MDIAAVTNSIKSMSFKRMRPIVIGIEGFGGSGKTTVSKQLAQDLGKSYVIHIDDFIVKEMLSEPAWDTGVFDHRRLEKQVLVAAASGKEIIYQKLLYDSNCLGDFVKVPPVNYLIIEGISCYIPSLRQYYDIKIWVDTPIRAAKERGIAREGTHGSAADWESWATIDVLYQKKYHPEIMADFSITNG